MMYHDPIMGGLIFDVFLVMFHHASASAAQIEFLKM